MLQLKYVRYYEVAPTKVVRSDASVFTYGSEESLEPGLVVTVPVSNKNLVGVIMKSVDKPAYAVKPILSIVTSTPLPPSLIATASWMSQYYHTHLALVWQTLLPSGITKKRRQTTDAPMHHQRERTKKVFTPDQKHAIDTIDTMSDGTALLHGVTGAGKTLVYIESARRVIAKGSSVIILVPEIALTSQLVAEFAQHFPNIIITHSHQTEAERHKAWQQALTANTPQVVIGPRSALFLPLANLGLIVIDECHEPSFKQEQSPRYSALRTASVLAHYARAKVILGSATPSVADYFLAKHSGRPIISLPTPARKNTLPPTIHLIDMTKRTNFTRHPFLSDSLLDTLERTFSTGHQALIFHNRRGTASTTLCTNCGWHATCPRCFVPFTLHADQHRLQCHICGSEARIPTSCPSCHAADIIHKGIGTKKIEEALRSRFPDKTIMRFDADSSADETVDKNYTKLYDGDIDIIIGTQVIAKGLDLPHLRTVGVIQADAGLSLPDFGAPERTFQLLSQVIGRVGRSHHKTDVVIQSYQPNDPTILDGVSQNYAEFYTRTLTERKHAGFPPFCYLLKATCVYKTERAAISNAKKVAYTLKNHAGSSVQVLGPTPAFYERVRDTYRWQLVVKSPRRQELIDLLAYIPQTHWQTELDPTSLL